MSGIWRIEFVCEGTTGHGSLLHENTAGEKLRRILGWYASEYSGSCG